MKRRGDPVKWPYFKPGVEGFFNVSSVVSLTGTKSAKYISEIFGIVINTSPRLISDEEIKEKLDISFCSIGGYNNLKTKDILENDQNVFFGMDIANIPANIFLKKDNQKKFPITKDHDHGLIIKIIPKGFPNRVWICVAGLGEWGTSGAVWFLMRNWKELPKNKSFGLVIKTKRGQDESAELVYEKIKEIKQ